MKKILSITIATLVLFTMVFATGCSKRPEEGSYFVSKIVYNDEVYDVNPDADGYELLLDTLWEEYKTYYNVSQFDSDYATVEFCQRMDAMSMVFSLEMSQIISDEDSLDIYFPEDFFERVIKEDSLVTQSLSSDSYIKNHYVRNHQERENMTDEKKEAYSDAFCSLTNDKDYAMVSLNKFPNEMSGVTAVFENNTLIIGFPLNNYLSPVENSKLILVFEKEGF